MTKTGRLYPRTNCPDDNVIMKALAEYYQFEHDFRRGAYAFHEPYVYSPTLRFNFHCFYKSPLHNITIHRTRLP